VPADASVTITMQNQDQAVPHDVKFNVPGEPTTGLCSGPCTRSVTFTAPAGTYSFQCTLHPDMAGTITAR
jgi:plastocyanin